MKTVNSELVGRISNDAEKWLQGASDIEIAQAIAFGYQPAIQLSHAIANKPVVVITNGASNIPTFKGQAGEAFIEATLRSKFSNVTNVAKESKSGDLTLFVEHNKIIVEVKNYSNNVPTMGVDKFRRDLGTTNAAGGVFISLRTPITNVTSDFAIRFEYSGIKTVPCAYIVSDDEHAIIVAVNVISQMITSTNYINTELHNKDKILDGVYQLGNSLDDLSRARDKLQCDVGEITTKLMKTVTGVSSVEKDIRSEINTIKKELFNVAIINTDEIIRELEKNNTFNKYTTGIKSLVMVVMSHIQSFMHREDINGSVWKLSSTKCINTITGIGFHFLSSRVDICIPRCRTNDESLTKLILSPGTQISIDKQQNITITLDNASINIIQSLIY